MRRKHPNRQPPRAAKAYFRRNARRARWRGRLTAPGFYVRSLIWVLALVVFVSVVGADVLVALFGARHAGGCRVLSATDGDTVRLYCPGRGMQKARLLGFGTPEVFSPKCRAELWKGMQATWALRGMLLHAREMAVVREGADQYDRALVFMSLDGVPLARRMVEAGLARPYYGGRRSDWCRAV